MSKLHNTLNVIATLTAGTFAAAFAFKSIAGFAGMSGVTVFGPFLTPIVSMRVRRSAAKRQPAAPVGLAHAH